MHLRQLQIANDSVQDRLLLRVSTHDNEEIRIWITRRFLRQLWPHLTQINERALEHTSTPSTGEKPASSTDNATFDQAFIEDNPYYPLGKEPLLASEANLDVLDNKGLRLTLREGRERSFVLDLDADLFQVFYSMLRAAVQQADWHAALETLAAPTPAVSTAPLPRTSSKLLH